MALITCPECGKDISEKSATCIHCGYPIAEHIHNEELLKEECAKASLKERINQLVFEADNLKDNNDYQSALLLYEEAGELGDIYSQICAGNIYDNALGVSADYEKAFCWFQKAAEQNDMIALNNLAMMYAKGKGVRRNTNKAIDLFKKASELGNAVASGNLGILYEKGTEIERDFELAVHYYTLAIKQGSKDHAIMNNLAVCHMEAKGTPKDYEKAKELLGKAVMLGDEKARANLESLRAKVHEEELKAARKAKIDQIGWIVAIVVAILGLLVFLSIPRSNSKKTCVWCNGTGYNGNGAKNVVEYVYNKTPCTHCDGKGTY